MTAREIHPARAPSLVAVAAGLILALAPIASCNRDGNTDTLSAPTPTAPSPVSTGPAVYVVLFTHIEDNTPAGALTLAATRTAYAGLRGSLVAMAEQARATGMPWSLQPDWKFLEAGLLYEDPALMSSTGGVNVLRHLRDTLAVTIDPHSHENGGYNYTDVADLLERLGVGGSTVIGGHIWDPALPQFQEWDRFRQPVRGLRYPSALWRGDILMGSGTPNHVNDPVVSGVWRPRSRFQYFEDDPAGNIACVGAYKADLAGISELVARRRSGQIRATCMLTASYHIRPADILSPGGASAVAGSVLAPLAALRASGDIELTTFSELVATWRSRFEGRACTFDGRTVTPPQ